MMNKSYRMMRHIGTVRKSHSLYIAVYMCPLCLGKLAKSNRIFKTEDTNVDLLNNWKNSTVLKNVSPLITRWNINARKTRTCSE